jgi:alpha-beta hydrolase superfamily lysophospholipase
MPAISGASCRGLAAPDGTGASRAVWPQAMEARVLDDGTMSYRVLPAEAAPAAAVLFAHGFAESAMRHAPTLEAFARAGIAAYAYDLRGHGRSPGSRGFIRRFGDLLDASALARTWVAADSPGTPLFLMGYSLGGLVSVRSAERDPDGLAGVVLVAPGFEIAGDLPAIVRRLGVVVGDVLPHVPVAQLRLKHLRPDEPRPASLLEVLLPRDPLIPARTAAELIRASDAALAGARDWSIPTLVVHGDLDRVVPLACSSRFVERASHAETTLDVIHGGHHDLLHGRDADAVRAAVLAWIQAHAQ